MTALPLDSLLPGLSLANPAALGLLLLLPGWLWAVRRKRRATGGLVFPSRLWFDGLPRSPRVRLEPLPDLLRALVLVALALALSRPQWGHQTEKIEQKGVDIMLALDLSGSMTAADVPPSRCEVARACLLRFLDRLKSDRCGLVVFAKMSFTQCPLTTDYAVLAAMARQCTVGMVDADGTAIGDALANCLYRLKTKHERETPGAAPEERSRVVVLLTDGENNEGLDPLKAAQVAVTEGVRIHCIGLGTLDGSYLQARDADGQASGYLLGPHGQRMVSRLNEPQLQQIAEMTGGLYFRATDAESLDRIYQRIAEMEKHTIEVRKETRHEERFVWPLAVALGLWLLELLLRATWLRVEV